MRIGIDCRMYDTGFTGIGRYVFNLVKYLLEAKKDDASQKYSYTYVLFFDKGQGIEVSSKVKSLAEIVKIDAPYYSWSEQLSYPSELRKQGLDLMHFTHFNAPLMYRGKTIVTIHDLTLSKFPSHKRNAPWHRAAYQLTLKTVVRRAAKVIAVSENTKHDLVEMLGTPAEKIVAIHEAPAAVFFAGISGKDVINAREKYGTGDNYFLYTGVWRPHKNLVRLVDAFACIKKHGSNNGDRWSDIKLIIAGKEDSTYPDVKERIKLLGLQNDVITPGFIDENDLPALVKGARAYVFPSLYEGFGLPPLEAMACGTPVCVARSSSLPEVCGLENAHFFDPMSVDDMTHKLVEFLEDGDLQKRYSERGLKRAAEFSWARMAKETRAVYDSVLRPESAPAESTLSGATGS